MGRISMLFRLYLIVLIALVSIGHQSMAQGSINLSKEVVEKLKKTPVGFLSGTRVKINSKALRKRMPDGQKILSAKIVYREDVKTYIFVRRFETEDRLVTNNIVLSRNGNGLYASSTREPFDCSTKTCQSCEGHLSGTGAQFCLCASYDLEEDCTVWDHTPLPDYLSNLFN